MQMVPILRKALPAHRLLWAALPLLSLAAGIPATITPVVHAAMQTALGQNSPGQNSSGQAAPLQTAPAPPDSCCGLITPQGRRLAQAIDSMHVEDKWQAREHVNWETGEPDKPVGYTGSGKSTHCSAFAAALGERLNVYMLRPPFHSQILLASAQAEWFHAKGGENTGWKPLEGPGHDQTAQELANQGSLVVIVYESPDPHTPGHIVIVRPSEKSAARFEREGPQVAEAGTVNHSSFVAALSFTHHPGAWPDGVKYYWHKVDWASVAIQ